MRGRLFTLLPVAVAVSGCLSVLAPQVDRSVAAHAGVRETSAPSTCLVCHLPEPVAPVFTPSPMATAGAAPGVPEWMLSERAGECLACHGVGR